MEASRSLQRPVLVDAAFDRLVRAHRAPLERYVRGLGASREDAEEIAATALLRAYQSPPAARRDSEWRAWLSTVARNVWIDARRRRELRLVTGDGVLESVPSDNASVDQVAATAEEARQICAAIALLPPAQRAAIYLREVRGLSYGEIAAQLGITIMAATAILQRARGNVKERRGGLSGALSALAFSPLPASSLRHDSLAQQLSGPLPGSPAPEAAATADAGVPATAPITVTTGAEHTGNPGKPAPGAHKQPARNAAAQHARNPPRHTRDSAPGGLRGVAGKHAAARPATAAAPSTPGAPTPPQTPAAEPPAAHGPPSAHAQG